MPIRGAVGRSAFWGSLEAVGSAALQFAGLVVLARLVAPEDFGLAVLAIAIVYSLNPFVHGFFERAIVQRADLEATHLDTAFWVALGAAATIVTICSVAAEHAAAAFAEPALVPLLRWMSPLLVLGSFNGVAEANLRRRFDFRPGAVASLVGRVLSAVFAITAALAGLGVWSFAAQQIGLFGGRSVTLWMMTTWRPAPSVSWRHLRELCQFAVPSAAGHTLAIGNDQLFLLLAGNLFGPVGLGYLGLAVRVSGSLSTVLAAVSRQISLSVLARQQHAPAEMRQSVYRATGVTTLLALPVFVGVIVCAEPIVVAVFGPQWSAAVPIVQLIAVASALEVSIEPVRAAVDAVGRPAWHLLRGAVQAAVDICGLLLLAPIGLVAAGVVPALSAVLACPVDFAVARRLVRLGGRDLLASTRGPLVASLAMATVVSTVKTALLGDWSAAMQLLTLVPLGAVVYGGIVWLMEPALTKILLGSLLPAARTGRGPSAGGSQPCATGWGAVSLVGPVKK